MAKDYFDTRLLHGDCLDKLRDLPNCSVDSVVTDPPYLIGFMGKDWDSADGVAGQPDVWRECLRVLKPGGHLMAFGGTRTYHRMAAAIEDAGFEIRDSIHWTYGSGFPKSLDVSKAIDKQRYDRADIYRVTEWVRAVRDAKGISNRDIDAVFGLNGMAGHWTSGKSQPSVPTLEQVPKLLEVLGVELDHVPDEIRDLLWTLNGRKGQPGENWAKRKVTGAHEHPCAGAIWRHNNGFDSDLAAKERRDDPATDNAAKWKGWGTALKPSHEPIVVARKPLSGTVAATVLAYGTGALNIDGCRVGSDGGCKDAGPTGGNDKSVTAFGDGLNGRGYVPVQGLGRWPANTVLTHAAECGNECAPGCPVAALDRQQDGASRFFTVTEWEPVWDDPFLYVAKPSKKERDAGLDQLDEQGIVQFQTGNGASGKPSSLSEGRDTKRRNTHPTVKPVALMRHLVRLVTPPGGRVLDPFLGSGTTAVAAVLEGFDWVGCEMTDEYLPIIKGRVKHARKEAAKATKQDQLPLE